MQILTLDIAYNFLISCTYHEAQQERQLLAGKLNTRLGLCIDPVFSAKRLQLTVALKLSVVLTLIAFIGSGCSSLAYYSQAVTGHLKLMNARVDVAKLLESSEVEPQLKAQLRLALRLRAFASERLGLPDNDSYKSFVKTGKKFITWNVVAAEEFSVIAKTWCFPFAGCVNYKGFFKQEGAQKLAAILRDDGFDTSINGATAYSTIGWFDDPLLDTMLRGHELRLAGLIFHELAHQKQYIKGDSDFNEAYASFVEQKGVIAWLSEQDGNELLAEYSRLQARRSEFSQLLLTTREKLQLLYQTELSDSEKRKQKQHLFELLRLDYEVFKSRWQEYTGYDDWFRKDLNNARIVATSTYRRLIPAFEALYKLSESKLDVFFKKTKELAKLKKAAREDFFAQLLVAGSASVD